MPEQQPTKIAPHTTTRTTSTATSTILKQVLQTPNKLGMAEAIGPSHQVRQACFHHAFFGVCHQEATAVELGNTGAHFPFPLARAPAVQLCEVQKG